jgi:hypothetical protein
MKEDLSRRGPGYVLSNAGVQSILTAAENLDEAVAQALLDQKAPIKAERFEGSTADTEVA